MTKRRCVFPSVNAMRVMLYVVLMLWAGRSLAAYGDSPVAPSLEALAHSRTAPTSFTQETISKKKIFRKFIRFDDGQYGIAVYLNAQGPFWFMVDTGASKTSLFEKTRQTIQVPLSTDKQTMIRGMGGERRRPVLSLNNLEFSGKKTDDVEIAVLKNWEDDFLSKHPMDGILGMDLLGDMILRFSHQNPKKYQKNKPIANVEAVWSDGRLRVYSANRFKLDIAAKKYSQWTQIALFENPFPVKKYGLAYMKLSLGNRTLPALLDTGASFTILNWRAVKNTPLEKEQKRLHHEWTIQGAVGQFNPTKKIMLDVIKMGGMEIENQEIILAKFDGLPIDNYGQYPIMIAGINTFTGKDFVLDMKHQTLWLKGKKRSRRF